jgi:diguanylate cyclase (GGDEF)-like protein/PAS domain S-box-containing protein
MRWLPRIGSEAVLGLWLCIAIWIGIDLHNSRQREHQAAERIGFTLTRVLEGHLQAVVDKIDQRLVEFVDLHGGVVVGRAPRDAVEPALRRHLANFPEAMSFRVADASGRYLYDATGRLSDATIEDREYFIRLRDDPGAGLVISGPLQSRVTGDWVFVLGRRIDDRHGRFSGVVLSAVRADFFAQFFSALDVGKLGTIGLWSADLELVACWPRLENKLGGKLEGTPVGSMITAGAATGSFSRTPQFDGIERKVMFRKAEKLPFLFTVGLAEREFLAEWRQRALANALLGAALALVFALLVTRWMREYQHAENLAREMTEAFMAKEREARALIDAIPAPAWLVDTSARVLAANEAFCRALNLPMDQVIGKTSADLFPGADAEKLREAQLRAYRANGPVREEAWLDRGNGPQPYEFLRVPVFDKHGKPCGLAGVAWDISARYEAEQRQRLVAHVFDNSHEGLLVLERDGKIALCNRAFERFCGYAQEELIGRYPTFMAAASNGQGYCMRIARELRSQGDWRGEIWINTRSGEERAGWFNASVVVDEKTGTPLNFIVQSTDLTERKASEQRIEELVTRDQMTGLPNRPAFAGTLGNWLEEGRHGVLLIFDLDNLGRINDGYGHETGDFLLRVTSVRLRRALRESDYLGRLGGDQFGILATGHYDPESIEAFTRRLLDAIAVPVSVDGVEVLSTACAGLCLFPLDGVDAAVLLRNADAAMHKAKSLGQNQFLFFSREMNQQMAERLRLESDLRLAIERNNLKLHYQPQLSLADNRVVGCEALLRWSHPELGNIPPDRFIPLAEENRLILPLGRWVIGEACRQNRAWQDAGMPPMMVAVNLSAIQLYDAGIIDHVREALAVSGLDPRWLELEITETAIMHKPDYVIGLLGQLVELGVRLAIDDFGTGYSSLAYLKRFPLDKLKIDRSFVTDIEHDANDAAIVRMVIGMSKELDIRVIAEGVETEGQRDFLRHYHCDEIQGYLLSRPLSADEIPAFVEGVLDSRATGT